MTTEDQAVIGEGDMPLVSDVSSVVQAIGEQNIAASIEAGRLEQEMICGYPLVTKATRYTHMRDAQGRDVYEIFATYAPAGEGDAA